MTVSGGHLSKYNFVKSTNAPLPHPSLISFYFSDFFPCFTTATQANVRSVSSHTHTHECTRETIYGCL